MRGRHLPFRARGFWVFDSVGRKGSGATWHCVLHEYTLTYVHADTIWCYGCLSELVGWGPLVQLPLVPIDCIAWAQGENATAKTPPSWQHARI
eukprot:5771803-Lingulodinium_polyedra.AAC.1